jgi:hypothetical protein
MNCENMCYTIRALTLSSETRENMRVNWLPPKATISPPSKARSHALTADEIRELTEWAVEVSRSRHQHQRTRFSSQLNTVKLTILTAAALFISTATPPDETRFVLAQAPAVLAPAWLAFQKIAPLALTPNLTDGNVPATAPLVSSLPVETSATIRLGDAMPISATPIITSPKSVSDFQGNGGNVSPTKPALAGPANNASAPQNSTTPFGFLAAIFSGAQITSASTALTPATSGFAAARTTPMASAAAVSQSITNAIGHMNQAAAGQRKS